MFRNYLIIAWRNLIRQRVFSLINIAGLSVGLAACLLIALFVADEMTFDRFHKNADQIYRVIFYKKLPGQEVETIAVHSALGDVLKQEFPEVAATTRLSNHREAQFFYKN